MIDNRLTKKRLRFTAFDRLGSGEERLTVIENIAMLVGSGMALAEALTSVGQEIQFPKLQRIVAQIKKDVEAGMPLWHALSDTNLFDQHTLSLIRIGEESGQLPQNLQVVAQTARKQQQLKSKIRSALLYPAFVIGVTLVVGVGVAWFILPRLASVFDRLNTELPLITKWIIGLGELLGSHGALIIPLVFLFFVIIFVFLFVVPVTKWIGQWILLHTPIVGTLLREVELARMGYVVGGLLHAGITLPQALESVRLSTTHYRYRSLYAEVKQYICEGFSFAQCFDKIEQIDSFVPPLIQHQITAGEQSGTLAEVFESTGSVYEEKTERTIKNLTTLLEPILLVVIWVGVVGIALAVIMPIYGLLGSLK